jgi:hypothetical protein
MTGTKWMMPHLEAAAAKEWAKEKNLIFFKMNAFKYKCSRGNQSPSLPRATCTRSFPRHTYIELCAVY